MNELPASSETAVDLQGVTKLFGRKPAVDGVTLQLPRGSVFGLIGPNGAGKSTLIKMLMGLLPMDSGRAVVLGCDVAIHRDRIHRLVGYVPETPTMYRWMTVGQVIHFCRTFRSGWRDDLCTALAEQLELDPAKQVKHLSKGMQTKLSLLLALAYEPELLILDEPTSGLDPVVREEFLEPVLRVVCERECTVLFSSHAIDDVERLANHAGLLLDGRLCIDSAVDRLLSETKRLQVVLSDGCLPREIPEGTIWQSVDRREWLLTVMNCSPEVVARLRANDCVERVEVGELSLNTLFKDYVKGRKALEKAARE